MGIFDRIKDAKASVKTPGLALNTRGRVIIKGFKDASSAHNGEVLVLEMVIKSSEPIREGAAAHKVGEVVSEVFMITKNTTAPGRAKSALLAAAGENERDVSPEKLAAIFKAALEGSLSGVELQYQAIPYQPKDKTKQPITAVQFFAVPGQDAKSVAANKELLQG